MNSKYLRLLLLSGTVIPISCAKKTTKKLDPNKKPNIIFIMSDDHGYQAISAYGSKLIKTPNIDRIAKQGMTFTNACVTNSISAPSRATILTGKHCHINGKIDNNSPFDTTQITFPQIFQQNGYKTAMFGKLHFGNNPKGVDEYKILPDQGFYINPDFITNKGDTTINGYVTEIITDLTIDWLKKQKQNQQPFMMMCFHKSPHRPWWPTPERFAEFYNKKFPEPETLFDNYSNRGTAAKTAEMNLLNHMMYSHDSKVNPKLVMQMGEKVQPKLLEWEQETYLEYSRASDQLKAKYDITLEKINKDFKQNWPKMSDEEKMRWKYQRYMQDYLATVSIMDDNIGRLLDYLEKSGLAENTIVVYTSDQGFYLGDHGWFDKRFIYDQSFKTPLIFKWPGHTKAGSVENEMVQNLDYAQTLLEIAGIKAPKDMQGESIVPLLEGKSDKWKRKSVYYHYYEYPSVHMVKRHYGVVTKEYKLAHFYYDIDEWELYDRLNDPNELNNVYHDPKYQEVVIEMKNELKKLRLKYKDNPQNDEKFLYKKN